MHFVCIVCVALLASCASHKESLVTEHETAQVHADEHETATSSTDEASHQEETREQGPVDVETVTTTEIAATPTQPARTVRVERKEHRAPVTTEKRAQATEQVRASMQKDAAAIFSDTADKRDEEEGGSKPSLGFLFGLWPFVAVGGLVFFLVFTGTNPLALGMKVVAWFRKRASAG